MTRCTMCEQMAAVVLTKWPGPVCKACDAMLDVLGADLAELEDSDPDVAAAADAVDDALRDFQGGGW